MITDPCFGYFINLVLEDQKKYNLLRKYKISDDPR